MTTVLFAGGGSGGHLFPGLAVAEMLAQENANLRAIFVGSGRPIERRILSRYDNEQVALNFRPPAAFLRSPLSTAICNLRAYQEAVAFLQQTVPRVVVGLGGFASVPTVLAARRLRVPVVLLEQNAVLGRANHFLLRFADRMCLSYPETPLPARQRSKAVLTGNPVRPEVLAAPVDPSPTGQEVFTLLILGGSQGASIVNELVVSALGQLPGERRNWRVIHQTGSEHVERVKREYASLGLAAEVSAFIADMHSVYQQADLVISRAGGTTLAELAVQGIPAVLIPYPGSIRDHQWHNAEHYVQAGAAEMVEQSARSEQTSAQLAECLGPLLTQADRRATMRQTMLSLAMPQAARVVADVIQSYCVQEKHLGSCCD